MQLAEDKSCMKGGKYCDRKKGELALKTSISWIKYRTVSALAHVPHSDEKQEKVKRLLNISMVVSKVFFIIIMMHFIFHFLF